MGRNFPKRRLLADGELNGSRAVLGVAAGDFIERANVRDKMARRRAPRAIGEQSVVELRGGAGVLVSSDA